MTCDACHADPHLGQVGQACERCHAIDAAKFAPARFSHETAKFRLSGRHKTVECIKCHPSETRRIPRGPAPRNASARPRPNAGVHKDPHLGQVDSQCATCHTTSSFKLLAYAHRGMDDLFASYHGRLPCKSCHKTETGSFQPDRARPCASSLGGPARPATRTSDAVSGD